MCVVFLSGVVPNSDIIVTELEHESRYFVHFQSSMKNDINLSNTPRSYGLNITTVVQKNIWQ